MTRHRLVSLLLALALFAGAGTPARCAGQPTVVCETGVQDGVISLSLEDLDGSAVYGVQVELVLSGSYDRCTFTPSSRTAYSPDCAAEERRGNTVVTVYLTDRAALNKEGKLDLGRLDLGGSEPVGWDVLPDTAAVVLLDQQLRASSMSGNLPVTATAPTGTGRPPAGDPGTPVQPDTPEPQLPSVPSGPSIPSVTVPAVLPFTDVAAGDWYRDAVAYVYAHSIMSGTGDGLFSPQQNTTRGMIVTMLHRLEGSPAALPAAFTDVPAGAYYAGPVAWASENGIVTGTGDGLFSPESPITREQLAAILYRYAQYRGLNAAVRADLDRFPDRDRVSSYANDAMRWAVGAGLITGSDGMLVPAGNATRAQVAAIFQRLCVNLLGMN